MHRLPGTGSATVGVRTFAYTFVPPLLVMAGVVLHDGHWLLFVAILVLGCALVAASAFGIERIVTPAVNGLREEAVQAGAEIPHVPVHD